MTTPINEEERKAANYVQTKYEPDEKYERLVARNAFLAGSSSRQALIDQLEKENEQLKHERQVVLTIIDGGKTDAYEKLSSIQAYLMMENVI